MFVHHLKVAVLVVLKFFSPENIRDWVFIAEIITAILALVFYKKYKGTFLRYFLFIIWYSIVNEVFAMYYAKHINENNLVLFNVNKVLEFSFYLFLYRSLVETKIHKKTITVFIVLYYFSLLINCFFQNFLYEYFSNTYFLGAVFIISSIVMYFSEILNSEKIIYINRTFIFWLSIAVFLLYITSIPFKVMMNYYQESPVLPMVYLANFAVVFLFCILVSIGLVWSKAEK